MGLRRKRTENEIRLRLSFIHLNEIVLTGAAHVIHQSVSTESKDGRNGDSLTRDMLGDAVDAAAATMTFVASLERGYGSSARPQRIQWQPG